VLASKVNYLLERIGIKRPAVSLHSLRHVDPPRISRHLHKWENDEIGGQHARDNATSVHRCIQVRGGLAYAGIGSTGGPVAWKLGISDNVLDRWRTEQRQVEAQGRTHSLARAEQDELTRRKRENETLRKERDFLQRAAAFFARESP
jgi:transposase